MAEPTKKANAIEELLREIIGADRRESIQENKCIPPPIGCGGPAVEFKDVQSEREFAISGLCQNCQDKIFKDWD